MSRQKEMLKERLKKIEELKKIGVLPYNYRFEKKENCSELQKKYKNLKEGEKTNKRTKIAGRIIGIRDIGKIIFVDLIDGYGKIQLQLQIDIIGDEKIKFFKKYIDVGDFIGIEGNIIKTKRGELTILVKNFVLLTKSLFPLPEKWHGLKDVEERYRKRYLDLIMNPNVKKVFEKRAEILRAIREYMEKNGFIEIETPLLQPVYGGAHAKPFKTHCDAYNSDLFLSIAPELYLKKALVGGFEKVYEITKKFRNEGIDKHHNPEHMTIEWYEAYADYNDGMRRFEELIRFIAKKLIGKEVIEYQGNKIDLRKWKKITLRDAIKKYTGIDIEKIKNDKEAKKIAEKHGLDINKITKVNLPDELLKLFREKLIQPTFLIDYPIELAPLAKPKRNEPNKAEIFQPFIGGIELARAYSELNDPLLQEKHFDEQEKERKKGNEEAMPTDRDFIEALKYGMPPACGVGIGIERLVMLFTDQKNIRDVILFPFMKPKKSEKV